VVPDRVRRGSSKDHYFYHQAHSKPCRLSVKLNQKTLLLKP
jgi:hypothetical protein